MAVRTVYGLIGGAGNIISGSGDYQVFRIETGLYTVIFTKAFNTQPTVVATQAYPADVESAGGDTRDNLVVVGISADRVRFKTGDPNGVSSDRAFSFIAMGT